MFKKYLKSIIGVGGVLVALATAAIGIGQTQNDGRSVNQILDDIRNNRSISRKDFNELVADYDQIRLGPEEVLEIQNFEPIEMPLFNHIGAVTRTREGYGLKVIGSDGQESFETDRNQSSLNGTFTQDFTRALHADLQLTRQIRRQSELNDMGDEVKGNLIASIGPNIDQNVQCYLTDIHTAGLSRPVSNSSLTSPDDEVLVDETLQLEINGEDSNENVITSLYLSSFNGQVEDISRIRKAARDQNIEFYDTTTEFNSAMESCFQ